MAWIKKYYQALNFVSKITKNAQDSNLVIFSDMLPKKIFVWSFIPKWPWFKESKSFSLSWIQLDSVCRKDFEFIVDEGEILKEPKSILWELRRRLKRKFYALSMENG